ncbi:MAG: hypothetical protein IIA73_04655 [Proteobacteria bacterium]|nr:hypothetical protein [Pseudomonadota bacterium]
MRPRLTLLITTVVVALCLGRGTPARAQEAVPYPVWWSPSLELESLDKIDERLKRNLWPGDDGFRLFVGIGNNRTTVIAHSCADIRRYEKEGSGAIDSPDIYLWLTVYRECVPIERLRDARPARSSHVRNFVLDAGALDYLPAMVTLSPSCDWWCRLYAANERRIPLSKFEDGRLLKARPISDYQLEVETELDIIQIEILARADFNGDGWEDLFMKTDTKSKEGRWGDDTTFMATRESPDDVLWVLDADRFLCRKYKCAAHYDKPPALR